MSDDITDTQARRMPNGTPKPEGAAITPVDTGTGTVRPGTGPMDRPGTEAAEAAKNGPPGDGPGFEGEEAAAYRENDA